MTMINNRNTPILIYQSKPIQANQHHNRALLTVSQRVDLNVHIFSGIFKWFIVNGDINLTFLIQYLDFMALRNMFKNLSSIHNHFSSDSMSMWTLNHSFEIQNYEIIKGEINRHIANRTILYIVTTTCSHKYARTHCFSLTLAHPYMFTQSMSISYDFFVYGYIETTLTHWHTRTHWQKRVDIGAYM